MLNDGRNNKAVSLLVATDTVLSFWNLNKNEKFFSFDMKEELNGMITAIRPVVFKENLSFVFSVNHLESDGKVYVFSNMDLLDIEKHQANVI